MNNITGHKRNLERKDGKKIEPERKKQRIDTNIFLCNTTVGQMSSGNEDLYAVQTPYLKTITKQQPRHPQGTTTINGNISQMSIQNGKTITVMSDGRVFTNGIENKVTPKKSLPEDEKQAELERKQSEEIYKKEREQAEEIMKQVAEIMKQTQKYFISSINYY